jgi:long-chain fatty acid transport protein
MNKITFKIKLIIYSLALLISISSNANAGGYSTSLYSTSGLGNAYSGSTTGSHDVSDVYFNPAVTAGNDKSEIITSLSYLRLAIDPDNISSSSLLGTRAGSESRNVGTQKLIPALYFSSPINDKMAFNLAITSPFGLETKYNKNWPGRFRALDSSISTLNLNPSLAYKITNDLSFGAGLVAQYYTANLTKEVFTSPAFTSGIATVDGSDWGYGYNFGLKYDISKDLKVGLGYRSKIDYKLKGNVDIDNVDANGPLKASKFKAKTTTPESMSLGVAYNVNPDLQIVADSTWTRWSRLKKLDVVAQNTLLNNSTQFNWNDSYLNSVGANYALNKNNLLRTGLAYEKEAINNRNREPRVPRSDKYWITAGLNHKLGNGFEIDLAYVHQIYKTAKINIADYGVNGVEGSVTGKYNTSVDVVSVALKKQF